MNVNSHEQRAFTLTSPQMIRTYRRGASKGWFNRGDLNPDKRGQVTVHLSGQQMEKFQMLHSRYFNFHIG
jgi:hypothetical protein